jgi:hypothetical protein
VTNPDETCKRHKPQNRKASQNKPSQNANTTIVVLQLSENFEQLFFLIAQLKAAA